VCDKGISTPIRAKSAFQTVINLKTEQLSAANQGQHIQGFMEMTAPLSCTNQIFKSSLHQHEEPAFDGFEGFVFENGCFSPQSHLTCWFH